jgi:putative PEP-CTERM system TPR-repeat lipoprotein
MTATGPCRLASRSKKPFWAILAVGVCAFSMGDLRAAPAGTDNSSSQFSPEVKKLLDDSDKALASGNVNLALIHIKNAVRLAPRDGAVRVRLAVAILQTGQAVAAERELRQAMSDGAPRELAVPPLLTAMLQRNEVKELLAEFPDPPQQAQDNLSVDILQGRAWALQASARPMEARSVLDRSLKLRRGVSDVVLSARLALQQRDYVRASADTQEALKLGPTNSEALTFNVLIARQSGDSQKALAAADEFVRVAPKNIIAKVVRIELLLELKQTARAKQEVDVLLKEAPNAPFSRYFHGVLLAADKDFKGAWRELQNLPAEFIQSEPSIAMMVSSIAAANGNVETAGGILTTLIAKHPELRDARLQLSSIRLRQGSTQGAVDVLAPLKSSNDPAVHAMLAQAYLRLRQFDEALISLQIANSSPNASDLLKRQLALSQLEVGEADRAIQGLRELAQHDPGNAALSAPLIAALVRTSKWDEALAVADQMAAKTPKSPLPTFYRSQVFIAKGNLSEAAAALDKSLALDPKNVPALYYRASVSAGRGNFEDAKKDFQAILAQNPSNMLAFIGLTQLALNAGQSQEALALLDRAIKAAPNDATPRLALANYQISQAKYDDAQTTVNGLLQISRNNPEGLALQGQIQFLRGQPADAVKTFRSLSNANSSSPGAYSLLARALYATKDMTGAEDNARKAIGLTPDSAQARMDLINIQIGAGKEEAALATARTYVNAYPGPAADLLLGETLIRLKRAKEAEAVLDKSLSTRPDAGVALRSAQIAASLGNSKKAIATLAGWLAKNPDDFVRRREYAGLIMGAGDLAGARKEYETLIKQRPEDPITLNNLGYLLQKDNPDRAFSLLSQAVKIAPQSPEIADTLGWMKYQRRDHQGALPLLQRAHTADANSAPIAYHFALVLDATGKRAEAKTLLQETLARTPKFEGSDDAKQVLARW